MNRKEFLKNAAVLGIGAPFMASFLASCGKENLFRSLEVNFSGKVLIIGAGAAGLTAGHILNQNNIDFQILEASSVWGGRVKKIDGFADFPIDLGAEWIHHNPTVLTKMLNEPGLDAEVDILTYNPKTIYLWKDDKLVRRNFVNNYYSEHKFKNTTWFDFFGTYMVPNIESKIEYNTPVFEIDYSGTQVMVRTSNGTFIADKVIVTVPLTMLYVEPIIFTPDLPEAKYKAWKKVKMPAGLKVFMEFTERFYPDIINDGNLRSFIDDSETEKIFYDAALGKNSSKNILGLFTAGTQAAPYAKLTDSQIETQVLSELDAMYNGKASQTHIKTVVQNWSREPYIQGSYSFYDSYRDGSIETLGEAIDDKVYFAGEAYSVNDTATVHGAAETGFQAVKTILKG